MLDPVGLDAAVFMFMNQASPSTAQAAADFAELYDAYAQDAQFGSSTPTLTGRKAIFESTFAASLSSGVFATVCTALGNAVAAYWGSSQVPVVGAQAGVVVGCPGAASIAAALAALAPVSSASVAASTISGALHAATTTCTAAVTPPPGTVLPIA
jgi:hypothetical protein